MGSIATTPSGCQVEGAVDGLITRCAEADKDYVGWVGGRTPPGDLFHIIEGFRCTPLEVPLFLVAQWAVTQPAEVDAYRTEPCLGPPPG